MEIDGAPEENPIMRVRKPLALLLPSSFCKTSASLINICKLEFCGI